MPRPPPSTAATSSRVSGSATVSGSTTGSSSKRSVSGAPTPRCSSVSRAPGPRPGGSTRRSTWPAGWLALDELQEPAHRLLIELYARAGDRMAALRQYRECVRVLDRELGVAPLEETTALYAAINENAFAPAPLHQLDGEQPVPPGARRLPLVGRDRERQLLADVLSAVVARTVVSSWSRVRPGSARRGSSTSLPSGPLPRAISVARTRCSETESTLAYAVVADAIRGALAGPGARERLDALPAHWAAEAARLVPELAEGREPAVSFGEDPGARSRFLEGLSNALAASVRLVLVVDDAHWIDDGSLEVLAYVARRLRGTAALPGSHLEDRGGAIRARVCGSSLAEATRGGGRRRRSRLARLSVQEVAELGSLGRCVGAGPADLRGDATGSRSSSSSTSPPPPRPVPASGRCPTASPSSLGARRRLLRARPRVRFSPPRPCSGARSTSRRSATVSGRGDEEAVAALEELTRRAPARGGRRRVRLRPRPRA